MPGEPHEVLIVALREQPALLGTLVSKLTGVRPARGLAPVDATVRFVKTAEVTLDVLFRRGRRAWTIVEVQRAIDPKKRRRWLLAVGLLFDQTGTLGDLIVITPRADVARWAKRVVHARAPLGTEVRLKPTVLHLGDAAVDALLDEEHPELALFAAWAMQHRHGPKARAIVERAIELTDRLPRSLRVAQLRAILSVLSERMVAMLREASMNPDKIPETPAARKLRLLLEAKGEARGEAKGKQDALLTMLRVRGVTLTREDKTRVRACVDAATLDRWIERAVMASSMGEVLDAKPPASPARKRQVSRTRTAGAARPRVRR